ncbi:MAG: DUF1223 domain-containing protein [Hyphomicrobiaceae bacterium]
MSRMMHAFAATTALMGSAVWLGSLLSPALAQGSASGVGAVQVAPMAVVELFTSQGCSSCPPADALMGSLSTRKDLVALTFPVDYWDYLGWKDTLASPKFSSRQRAYAKKRGDGRIYTPQMVINGAAHVVGNREKDIEAKITQLSADFSRKRVPVVVHADKRHIVIEAGDAPADAKPEEASIWLAVVQPKVDVAVRTGENHGRKLTFYNVVRELTPVGMWNGKAMTVRLHREAIAQAGTETFAVLLQNGKDGPILGAAMLGKH